MELFEKIMLGGFGWVMLGWMWLYTTAPKEGDYDPDKHKLRWYDFIIAGPIMLMIAIMVGGFMYLDREHESTEE